MIDEIVVVFGFSDAQADKQDVEVIAEMHRKLESARRMIFSLVTSKGGRAIGQLHGNEIVVVPADQSSVVKEIHERLSDELGVANTVGVGEDAKEATEALNYARTAAPGSIKVYTPTMHDDGELSIEPQSVAVGEQDKIQKSEKYVPISEDEKMQIAQILQQVQANKQMFDQLQQQAPDIYASVVSVVQSLAGIMQQDKKNKEDHIAKMIAKITKYLQKQSAKQDEKYAKEIQRHIDRHSMKNESESRKKFKESSKRHIEKKKREREHLRNNPEHQLLFDLARGKF